MKENKMGNTWHVCIKSILHILLKSRIQKFHPNSVRKMIGGWEICSITLLKLPQNWVICMEKGFPNNFAQITTILGDLYWKHCLLKEMLMKYMRLKFFLAVIWVLQSGFLHGVLANDDNIYKKIFWPTWSICNTINWNNTKSTLWGQSNEKVLQLTEQHVFPQF